MKGPGGNKFVLLFKHSSRDEKYGGQNSARRLLMVNSNAMLQRSHMYTTTAWKESRFPKLNQGV